MPRGLIHISYLEALASRIAELRRLILRRLLRCALLSAPPAYFEKVSIRLGRVLRCSMVLAFATPGSLVGDEVAEVEVLRVERHAVAPVLWLMTKCRRKESKITKDLCGSSRLHPKTRDCVPECMSPRISKRGGVGAHTPEDKYKIRPYSTNEWSVRYGRTMYVSKS